MKIVSYLSGRCIGSEDPSSAYQTYLAMMSVSDNVDFFVTDPDLDYAVAMTDWSKAYNYAFSNFDQWFSSMIENHEVHVYKFDGDRLLDQILVTVG